MTTSIVCSPDAKSYTHHIKLVDSDGNAVGLNIADPNGSPDIRSFRREPYPKNTLDVNTGAGQWNKRRPPYGQISKSDWSAGFGMVDGEKDSTRYMWGSGVWTISGNMVSLAPTWWHAINAWPTTISNQPTPASTVTKVNLTGANRYMAVKFTPAANLSIVGIRVTVRSTENMGAWSIAIFTDTAGSPGSNVSTTAITYHTASEHEQEAYCVTTLTASTPYWLIVIAPNYASTNDEATFSLNTLANAAFSVKESADGSTWGASASSPFQFSLCTTTDIWEAKLLKYQWGMYYWCTQWDGTTKLFINGDRGCCGVNTGALTTLIDATKSWTVNQWAGYYVRIYGGPGSGEWRKISSNTATTLTLQSAWLTEHTINSTYVIIGSPYWTELTGHGLSFVEHSTVSKEGFIYFARGDTRCIRRMREYRNEGVWTREYSDDTTTPAADIGSSRLLAANDQEKGAVIWNARNAGYGDLRRAVSPAWGTNLAWETGIKVAGLEQDINGLAEADQKIYVLKMDAVWVISPEGKPAKIIDWPFIWDRGSGKNPCLYSPYIVFPVRNGLVRLYGQLMEDFGPNRDDGLPRKYIGSCADLMPLNGMGALLAGYDGGSWPRTGSMAPASSGIYAHRNGGWHPIADFGHGQGLYSLGWQDIDNRTYILWALGRDGLYYMPHPGEWDYRKDAQFTPKFCNDGYIICGRMNAGTNTLDKWWSQISIYGKDLHADYTDVMVYYRTTEPDPDSTIDYYPNTINALNASEWIYAGKCTAGTESTIPLQLESREIWFMLVLRTSNRAYTPIVYALSVDYLARMDDADSWVVPCATSDAQYDNVGKRSARSSKVALAVLDKWAREIEPLTMYSLWDHSNNVKVILQRPRVGTLSLDPTASAVQDRESNYVTLTILEA